MIIEKLRKAAAFNLEGIEDRIGRYLPDKDEQAVRADIDREKEKSYMLRNPGISRALSFGIPAISAGLGAGLGIRPKSGRVPGGITAGAIAGLTGLGIGAGIVGGKQRGATERVYRQYLRRNQDEADRVINRDNEAERLRKEEAIRRAEINRQEARKNMTTMALLTGAGMIADAASNRTTTQNINTTNKTAMYKEAVPWATIGKAITGTASKAMAKPLARRAIIGSAVGAGIGGTGNVLFGTEGSIAGRFARGSLAGAAAGAAGGTAYHVGTRLGMPSVTKMMSGLKTPVSVAPKVPKAYRGQFRMMNRPTSSAANKAMTSRINVKGVTFANKYNAANAAQGKLYRASAPLVLPPRPPKTTVPKFLKNL